MIVKAAGAAGADRAEQTCMKGAFDMIRQKILFWIGLAATSLVLTTAAPAQEIKLTLADQNSPTAWGPTHALYPWIKSVEAAAKGRLKIEVYPSQTLIKGVDMWNGVRNGIADIGWCVQGYWPEQTPLSDVISLPFLPIKTAEKGSEVLWKLYEKFPSMQKEYGEIQPLVLYTSSPNILISNKKQAKTLEDLKGLKVRVLGGPPTEMAKALGIVPTLIPMPDMYQALDKGVVDGGAVPWEAVYGFRLYEVGKYYTTVPFYAAYFSLCANRKKMESLPKDVRDAIMSVSGFEGSKFWGKNFFDTAEQAVIEQAKIGNYELNRYEPPAAEVARWSKIAGEPIWEAWVKKMEGKGHKEAREVLNTVLNLLKN
jgi:TRAP-type C4-dicarboxylate transport system substrate-binding protein